MTSQESTNEVTINAHRAGGPHGRGVYISWFEVPRHLRRQGLGTEAYEEFETELPKDVDLVYLHAADSGAGPSDGFWEMLGFDYVYGVEYPLDMEDLSIEEQQYMVKGIGRETPDPVIVTEEDLEE